MVNHSKKLGIRVRELRKGKHLSQEQLAERAGLSVQYLGSIERGEANPTLSSLGKLAAALGVSFAELFNWTHQGFDFKKAHKRLEEVAKDPDDPKAALVRRLLAAMVE